MNPVQLHRRARFVAIIVAPLVFAVVARAEPAMWVIRDKDSTIYLIGTVHLLKHETDWNKAKVMKAVADSTELWLEISDIDNQAALTPLIQQYGFDKKRSLSTKLNFVQNGKLARVAAQYNVPLANLEPMKPWMVALTFAVLPLQKAGYDPNAGVDLLLKAQAEKKGEKIYGFETMEQQVKFFADLPETDQIAFLEATLDDAGEGLALLDKLANAWLNGDNKTIADLLVGELKAKEPAVYQKLLVERNIHWSEKIAEILNRSGVQLVAVGAAHVVGPDSVQTQLSKRGITAESY